MQCLQRKSYDDLMGRGLGRDPRQPRATGRCGEEGELRKLDGDVQQERDTHKN